MASGLGVDGPRLLRPADQHRGIEVAGEVAPDPVREVVGLIHDEDDLLEGTLDPREDLLSDPAEDIVVVAHDDIGPPCRLHRGLVRARAACPRGLHELPHVEDLLRGELHRGVRGAVEPAARPRAHLGLAELAEGVRPRRGPVVQAHRVLRDDVDRDDPDPAGPHPTQRLHRDPVLALLRGQEEDELPHAAGELGCGREGDRGLPRPRGRVGKEMPSLPDRCNGIPKEHILTRAHRRERECGDDSRVHGPGPTHGGGLQGHPICRAATTRTPAHPRIRGRWPKVLDRDNRGGTVKYAAFG